MFVRYAIVLIMCGYFGAANAAYFGAGFGNATVDFASGDADSIDDSDSYIKFFGGFEINPNLSAEFGYIDFGEYSAHYPSIQVSPEMTGRYYDYRVIWFYEGLVTGISSRKGPFLGRCAANMQPIKWEEAPDKTIEIRTR